MWTRTIAAAGLLTVALSLPAVGCYGPLIGTAAPADAAFELSCIGGCGEMAVGNGVMIDVSFSAQGKGFGRQYALCCDHVPAFRARLQTVKDMWCDGLSVPSKDIGGLVVGTTRSEETGKRGATIDDGDGYVAFNCGEWLDKLIADTSDMKCCKKKMRQSKKDGSSSDDALQSPGAVDGLQRDGVPPGISTQ
jgi:hypothetical protein